MHQLLPLATESEIATQLHRWLRFWMLLLVFFAATSVTSSAQDGLSAKAILSRPTARVGEPLQLQIRVDGSRRPTAQPPDFKVEGLDIRYSGPETRMEMHNFNVSFGVIYTYQVIPERAGDFTIPGVTFVQDNQDVRTNPVSLRVQEPGRAQLGGGGRRRAPDATAGGQGNSGALGRVGWAEISLAKQSAYLGETIPVELRLFVDSAVRWAPESMPELEGEGFTKTKMPEPTQEQTTREGRQYDVLVFRTAITPSRAGKVKVGPSEIIYNATIPRAQPNRQRGASLDDFFQDFFNDPTGRMSRTEQRKAVAEPVELDVRPLPTEGKPASFSGAVGNFSMAVGGTPTSVQLGDPVTMTIRLVGRGNFDRVNAPILADPKGWRTYPPTSSFNPGDEVSHRGTKTFQMAVIPEAKKTAMPQFEFAYFDPEAEKYVVLKSEPSPLSVEGEARAATPAPAREPHRARPAAAEPPPADEPAPSTASDILGLRYDAQAPVSFTPLYARPEFWWAQALPAAALLLLLGSQLKSRPSAAAARAATLRREKMAIRSKLDRAPSAADFFDAAVRSIQLETAIHSGQSPDAVDARAACRDRQLSDDTAAGVEQIFSARAALRYAGGGVNNGHLSNDERSRVLSTLAEFEKSHGRN